MRTKKGYVLRPLGKEFILVAEGLEAADANKTPLLLSWSKAGIVED